MYTDTYALLSCYIAFADTGYDSVCLHPRRRRKVMPASSILRRRMDAIFHNVSLQQKH